MAVTTNRGIRGFRQWFLPAAAVLCVLAATLMLANLLRQREHHHIQHLTEVAAAAIKSDVETDLDSRFLSAVRTTRLWNVPASTTKQDWETTARNILTARPNLSAIALLHSDGSVWSVPPEFGQRMAKGVAGSNTGGQSAAKGPYFFAAFSDVQGQSFRRVVLPLSSADGGVNYGIVAFPERESLRELLSDINSLGYSYELSEDRRQIISFDAQGGRTPGYKPSVSAVGLPGLHWDLRVWPTPAIAANTQSVLSILVLAMGAVLAVFVGISTRFAQSVRSQNQKLTVEIAERTRYESALQFSQARLNGILETSADGIIAIDEQQRVTLFNKGAETIFGYIAEEVLGQPLERLIPAGSRDGHRVSIEDFGKEASGPRRMAGPREVKGLKKDGTEFPLEASISRVVTGEGVFYTSIVRDVTDRVRDRRELERAHQELEARVQERTLELAEANEWLRREIEEKQEAESRLLASEQRLQGILDNCTACVFMKDPNGRYLLINRWYETLFGLKNDETIGKTDVDIFPAEIAADLRRNDQLVLRSQHPIEFEENVAHPDGTVHTYITTKFLVRDELGGPFAICGIATDITRQKQAEELLSELSGGLMALQDEERKRLSRELHEGTAQMLAALEMNLELAKKLARDENQTVVSALDVSLELVEQSASQLRTMAYLLHPPGLDDFGLAPALRWFADGFSSRSGIKVDVQVDTEDTRFDRDVELAVFRIVQEALTNILRHAESKTARIVLRQREDQLELEVADTGHGISREVMTRMASGKTVPGIGITGIRERVRQLGGVFGLESGSDGARLTAKLPTKLSSKSQSAAVTQHS